MSDWIDVRDRLPDRARPVLVWDEYYLMCTAVIHMGNKWILDATYIDGTNRIYLESVTHWMPLPQPPVSN